MIQLILQLVFLPLRLFIDCAVGCFIAVIAIMAAIMFGLIILDAVGIL